MQSDDLGHSAILVRSLIKTFNHRPALKGIDLEIARGEKVVVFGPNGAGKTTLLKILSTVMKPSSGKVFMQGLDLKTEADAIRRQIGVVFHHSFLYPNLTARENLEFYARLYDIDDLEPRVVEKAGLVGMTRRLNDRVDTFSRGMQQRVTIARSLLHNPSILLMDEPETGLDQQSISVLWNILQEQDRTILLTTHNFERGMEIADRVIMLNRGKTVFDSPKSNLNASSCRETYYQLTGFKV
ncbi:ABC transporter related protein [Dehalogenimonas lykanthroporepellens BL-DC-9]|nr:ABC transporter related protein [Dehalogenimonas lykanthroporepellens BL-DC-9]